MRSVHGLLKTNGELNDMEKDKSSLKLRVDLELKSSFIFKFNRKKGEPDSVWLTWFAYRVNAVTELASLESFCKPSDINRVFALTKIWSDSVC